MSSGLKHKKWVYALAPVLLILMCIGLKVLTGLVDDTNQRLEDYREAVFREENDPDYNRYGLLGNTPLSTELLVDTGTALVYSDRVVKKLSIRDDAAQRFADSVLALQEFAGEDGKLVVLPVPKRAQYEPECMEEANAAYGSFLRTLAAFLPREVPLVDSREALTADDVHQLFYRTEDTWTMDGAYYGYRGVCEALGIVPREMDAFDLYSVNSFTGSLVVNMLTGLSSDGGVDLEETLLSMPADRFIYRYARDFVNYEEICSVNDGEYKRPVIQHTVMGSVGVIGGNYYYARIGGNGEGTVMVIADFSGKNIVPYLTEHFGEIIAVDLQNCKTEMMLELAAETGAKTFVIAQRVDEMGWVMYSRALNGLAG